MMFDKGQPPTLLVPQMSSPSRGTLLPANVIPISMSPLLLPAPPNINISSTLTPTILTPGLTTTLTPNLTTISLPSHTSISPLTLNAHTSTMMGQSGVPPTAPPYIPINVTLQPQLINLPTTAPNIYIKPEPAEVINQSSQSIITSSSHISEAKPPKISPHNVATSNGVMLYTDNHRAPAANGLLQDLVKCFDQSSGQNLALTAVKQEPFDLFLSKAILNGQEGCLSGTSDQKSPPAQTHIDTKPTENVPQELKITPCDIKETTNSCQIPTVSSSVPEQIDPPVTPQVEPESTVPTPPDTSALTTLAIVCDNVGSGKDRQYVVKVQLEEPSTVSSKRTKKHKQKSRSKNKPQSEVIKEAPPRKVRLAELALATSSEEEVDVSRVSDDEKTTPVSVAKPYHDDSSNVVALRNKQASKKRKGRRGKTKDGRVASRHANNGLHSPRLATDGTSSKESKAQDDAPGDKKSKKKNRFSELPLPLRGGIPRRLKIRANEFQKRIRRITSKNKSSTSTDTWTSLDDFLKNLNPTTESSSNPEDTQVAADMSPASTIPYGEDSNDSVDFSGRSMFQCTKCIKSYTSERRLRLHIGLIHQDSDKSPLSAIFSCKLCSKAYTSQKRLDLHVLLVHEHSFKYGHSNSPSSLKCRLSALERKDMTESGPTSGCAGQSGNVASTSGSNNNSNNCCLICGKKYSTQERLNLHTALIHETGKFSFTSKSSGKKIKREPGVDPVVEVGVRVKREAVEEEEEEEEEPVRLERPQFSCSRCPLVFTDKQLYQEHLPLHDQERKSSKPYKARRTFYMKKYYLEVDEDMNRIQCKLCCAYLVDTSNGANHIRSVHGIYHTDDQRLTCPYCGKVFNKQPFLTRHLNVHIGISTISSKVKKYKCGECSKSFSQKAHLGRHIHLKHTDAELVRVFTCDLCSRSFKLKSHLKRHMMLHQGQLPFKCSICMTAFADRNSLRNHIRVHTGERPYSCPHCEHAFAVKSNLKNHIINIHPEKLDPKTARKHQCLVCGKICHKGGLKQHIKTHDTEKTVKCELCPSMFKTRVLQRVHMRKIHQHHQRFYCKNCGKECKSRMALNRHMEKH